MKKKLLLVIPAMLCLLAGCGKGGNGGNNGDPSDTPEQIDTSFDVIVNFYLDYNNTHYKLKYYSTSVKNGSLITDIPSTPTAPSEDFPVFKGWSEKEITDDYEADIWNFSTSKVIKDKNSPTLTLYGIWSAE